MAAYHHEDDGLSKNASRRTRLEQTDFGKMLSSFRVKCARRVRRLQCALRWLEDLLTSAASTVADRVSATQVGDVGHGAGPQM